MRTMLAFFCLVFLVTGCGRSGTADKDKAEVEKKNDWESGPSASALSEEFKKDAKAAEKKYKDKSISFVGTVTAVMTKDDTGKDHVILLFEGLRKEKFEENGPDIECALLADATSKASGLIETQKVKVTGKYQRYGKDKDQPHQQHDQIYLTDVKIDDVGPDPTVAVSAVDLAKTFATDPPAAKSKYIGKMLVVEAKFLQTTGVQNLGPVSQFEGYEADGKHFGVIMLGAGNVLSNPPTYPPQRDTNVKFRAMCNGQVNLNGTPCVQLWPKLVKGSALVQP